MVNGSSFVRRFMVIIVSLTSVLNISNVSRIVISHSVSHGLGATIRKEHMVVAIGSIAITGLLLTKMKLTILVIASIATGSIVILGSISILVVSWGIIRRFSMVGRSMVDRSFVSRSMVDRGMMYRSMVDRSMMHRNMVDRGMMYRSMVDGMTHCTMISKGRSHSQG